MAPTAIQMVRRRRNKPAALLPGHSQDRIQRHIRHLPLQVITAIKGNAACSLQRAVSRQSRKSADVYAVVRQIGIKIHNIEPGIPPLQIHGVGGHIHIQPAIFLIISAAAGQRGQTQQRVRRRSVFGQRLQDLALRRGGAEPAGAQQELIARLERALHGEGRDGVGAQRGTAARKGRGRLRHGIRAGAGETVKGAVAHQIDPAGAEIRERKTVALHHDAGRRGRHGLRVLRRSRGCDISVDLRVKRLQILGAVQLGPGGTDRPGCEIGCPAAGGAPSVEHGGHARGARLQPKRGRAVEPGVALREDLSGEENLAAMTEAMGMVSTGQVTYAVRDTEIDDKVIKENDIMGIGDKGILAVGQDITQTTIEMVDEMMKDGGELISIYYGQDVQEADAEKLADEIRSKFGDCDVELVSGGQPIYYYMISVE